MCHLKSLNQHQQSNIEILDPKTLQKLKNGYWSNAPTFILKCVRCGKSGRITMPIVDYFNYDGTKLLCYECQDKLYGYKRLQ
jgi:hypothetical protein